MVYYPRVARSRIDDIFVPLSDTERRTLAGRCRTHGRDLAAVPRVPTLDELAEGLLVNPTGRSTVSNAVRLDRRTALPCDHSQFVAGCGVAHDDVEKNLVDLYEWIGQSVIRLLDGADPLTIDQVATFCAQVFSRVLRILPLDQGNLLIAEAYVAWASCIFSIAPAVPLVPGHGDIPDPDNGDGASTAIEQMERDAYDEAVRQAVLGDDIAPLTYWLDDRMKRWRSRANAAIDPVPAS